MAEKINRLPIVVNKALGVLEDPIGLARPLWRDYSRYQGYVNTDIAAANGVLGAAHRATISYGYVDPFFQHNYANLERSGIFRTSYHVIYPDIDVYKQLDNWYKTHEYIDIIPRVLDAELTRGQSPEKIGALLWESVEVVIARDGIPPILYSRSALLDSWLAKWTQDMLDKIWYWLAQYLYAGYLEHPGPPRLPDRVKESRVVLHQTSDHKLAPAGEVQSKAVDWDRWELGDEIAMYRFIRDNWAGTVPEPEPPIKEIEPIDHLRTTVNLNTRSLPDVSGKDIGTLLKGTDVSITRRNKGWGLVEGWIKEEGYTEPYE